MCNRGSDHRFEVQAHPRALPMLMPLAKPLARLHNQTRARVQRTTTTLLRFQAQTQPQPTPHIQAERYPPELMLLLGERSFCVNVLYYFVTLAGTRFQL
jgi:hypothetical protein